MTLSSVSVFPDSKLTYIFNERTEAIICGTSSTVDELIIYFIALTEIFELVKTLRDDTNKFEVRGRCVCVLRSHYLN